jgi:hypothetical protein
MSKLLLTIQPDIHQAYAEFERSWAERSHLGAETNNFERCESGV